MSNDSDHDSEDDRLACGDCGEKDRSVRSEFRPNNRCGECMNDWLEEQMDRESVDNVLDLAMHRSR